MNAPKDLEEAIERVQITLRRLGDAGLDRSEDPPHLTELIAAVDSLAAIVAGLVAGETVPVVEGQPIR